MFLCLTEILIQKQSAIKDFNSAFYYFLENTKIKSSLYPEWIEKPKTEEKIKFSVVLPIYNVEKYLNRCLDSVMNQTYKKLEIILVDDGSPDEKMFD